MKRLELFCFLNILSLLVVNTLVAQEPWAPPPVEKEADKKEIKLRIKGRIHAGWEMSHEADQDNENSFAVERGRLKFIWEPTDWVMGVVQLGVNQQFELGASLLKDAYIHLSALPQLELRIGQFKKPFSGLELRSPAKLRVFNRGPGNDLIIEDLRYGDRDLGVQISGRLIKSVKLDYSVGAFNGSGPNIADQGVSKDVVARLKIKPAKMLVIGANGSLKFFDNVNEDHPKNGWAAGGDARLSLLGIRLYAEALVGTNHQAWATQTEITDPPMILDVTSVLSYRHKFAVSWKFAVEPAFKFEMLEPDLDIVDDQVLVFSPGLNIYLGKYFRVMIDGEFLRSSRNSSAQYPNSESLMVMTCLDI